jgi:hypothetical protein
LANIVLSTKSFYGFHYSLYYQHGWHVKGVTIIESSSGTRQGDLLRSPLFALTHYGVFLKTIVQALGCVFPSLMDDTHIVGPMNEITHAFDHLSTQLTLVGLKVKMSKCKLWSLFRHKDFSRLHFGHRWFTHFGCASGFSRLCHTFFGYQ